MPKIVRYGGNLKAFASEQLTNERTLFGQVAIADDLTSQVTAQFLRGWGIVGPSDQPSLQDFNAAMYTNGQLLAYLHQMGVAEYNAAQEYFVGSLTQTGGVLYISLVNANVGNTPSTSPAQWKSFTTDQATEVALGLVKIATQALVIAGADDQTAVTPKKRAVAAQTQSNVAFSTTGTATAQVLTPVPAIAAYTASQRFSVTFNVASGASPTINVSGLGAKSVKQYDGSGTKVAAVWAAGQISDIVYDGTDFVVLTARPSLATDAIPGASRFGTPAEQIAGLLATVASNPAGVLALLTSWFSKRTFSTTDFIRIPDVPGGLIIQWGTYAVTGTTIVTHNFGTPFTIGALQMFISDSSVSNGATAMAAEILSTTQFQSRGSAAGNAQFSYLAIGQ